MGSWISDVTARWHSRLGCRVLHRPSDETLPVPVPMGDVGGGACSGRASGGVRVCVSDVIEVEGGAGRQKIAVSRQWLKAKS